MTWGMNLGKSAQIGALLPAAGGKYSLNAKEFVAKLGKMLRTSAVDSCQVLRLRKWR